MIDCPEFDYDYKKSHAIYLWCLHAASIISLIIDPLIIYCIVFRSTSHMATYRWFLLLHQVASLASDLWVNFFSQPVFLIPLPLVYMLGYAKYFLSTTHIWNVAQVIIVFEQITVIFLFFYRYQAVQNGKPLSVVWKGSLVFLFFAFLFNIYLPLTIEVKTAELFERLANNYTCVTPRLQEIDSIIAVDKMEAMKSFGLSLFDALIFLVIVFSLSVGCLRATRTRNMSPKLRQMQQRFLFQLCLQSFVPFLVVIGPIVVLILVVIFDIFGYSWINDIVCSSASIFSIISAIILFIMNPTYHQLLTRYITRKTTSIRPILS